jgi:hypothetical protein
MRLTRDFLPMNFFSFALFRIFSLSWIFESLTITGSRGQFLVTVRESPLSFLDLNVSFPRFVKSLAIISLNMFSMTFACFLFWKICNVNICSLNGLPQVSFFLIKKNQLGYFKRPVYNTRNSLLYLF